MCAELNMDEKNCSMTVDDSKVECDDFSIGSYSYLNAEGKKCKNSYAAFSMKDADEIDCSYVLSYNHATGETVITKSGMKILSSIRDNVEIINLSNKLSKAFFSEKPTIITMDQLIKDVFKMLDPQSAAEDECEKPEDK